MDWVDCHFHVVEPQDRFPMLAGRAYTPAEAPLGAWQATLGPWGFRRGVLVQPSFYGTDNTALLHTLARAGGTLVGVGAATDEVSERALDALALAGVRALRFAHLSTDEARRMPGLVPLTALRGLAPRLRARGMHVDLLTDSRLLPDIEAELKAAGLPVVLDHMGRAPAALGDTHVGMVAMRRLLDQGWLWVKLSGVANVSDLAPAYEDARRIHERLVSHCPERLVWGSDWPHTRPKGAVPSTQALWDHFLAWTPDPAQQRLILQTNPYALYRL